jgi:hypothetical protein
MRGYLCNTRHICPPPKQFTLTDREMASYPRRHWLRALRFVRHGAPGGDG